MTDRQTVKPKYTYADLEEFINQQGFGFSANKNPDPELCLKAAWALMDVLFYNVDIRKELGLTKKRGERGLARPKHIPEDQRKGSYNPALDGRIVTLVMKYLVELKTWGETRDEIAELCGVDERTAVKYIALTKQSAEQRIEFIAFLKRLEKDVEHERRRSNSLTEKIAFLKDAEQAIESERRKALALRLGPHSMLHQYSDTIAPVKKDQ